MDKQTKTLLGLGAIAVALYFILRPKVPNAQTPPQEMPQSILCNDGQMVLDNPNMPNAKFADPCLNHGGQKEIKDFDCPTNAAYCKYVIPSGIVFEGKLVGTSVVINDTPKNQYDKGGRTLREGEFKILQVIKDGVKDAPFIRSVELYNGAILSVITTKDVVADYQNSMIIYT